MAADRVEPLTGRALDRACARAMGYEARQHDDGLWDLWKDGQRTHAGPQRTEAECWEACAPRYSTDPALGGVMLELASERGQRPLLEQTAEGRWMACLRGDVRAREFGDTAGEALALALVAAAGGSDDA